MNANFVWEFVFNMYERKASPVGTIHEVDIDVNNDGTNDFFVINQDVGGVTALTDGRQVTAVINAGDRRQHREVLRRTRRPTRRT